MCTLSLCVDSATFSSKFHCIFQWCNVLRSVYHCSAVVLRLLHEYKVSAAVSQHVAAVCQDETFQWTGHRLKHHKYRTLPQDACIMDRSRPTNNTLMMLSSASHIRCAFIVWSFFRLTYSCSLMADVQSTQPITFGKFATTWNMTFMTSVSCSAWKWTWLGTSQVKAAATLCTVLQTVVLLIPNKSPTTNWKLPHTNKRNPTITWSVGVSEPFHSATKMLSPTISTKSMMSAQRKRSVVNNSAL